MAYDHLNKTAMMKICKEILYRYEFGVSVCGEDFDFILLVLRMHPNYRQKIGKGISKITVQKDPRYKSRCFYIHRKDGTMTDFSFVKCLYPPNNFSVFIKCLRISVEPYIIEYRNNILQKNDCVVCPESGDILSLHYCHVDHVYPKTFLQIVYDFIDTHNVDWTSYNYVENTDMMIGPKMESGRDVLSMFYDYHKSECNLRLVSPSTNLKGQKTVKR